MKHRASTEKFLIISCRFEVPAMNNNLIWSGPVNYKKHGPNRF